MPSLWHRVGADPGLTDAVRIALGDREDAIDLLWWAEHPGQPTPGGRADPSTAIERQRRALYREGAEAADPEAVAAALAAHATAVRRAVAAAESAITADESVPPRPTPLALTEDNQPVRSGGGRSGLPRSMLLAVLAAGIAFVAGITIGGLAFGSSDHAARRTATARAYRVFDRPQRPATDLPPEQDAVPSYLDRRTVRRLRSFSSVGTTLYAARTGTERVCILVVVLADPAPPACTSDAAFALGGLTLIVRAEADPIDDAGTRPVDELDITWNPDDTVSVTPYSVATASPSPSRS